MDRIGYPHVRVGSDTPKSISNPYPFKKIGFYPYPYPLSSQRIFLLFDRIGSGRKSTDTDTFAISTPDFRRVIVVIPLRLIDTFSLLMSPSSRTHPSSPPPSLFLLLKSYPFPSSPRLYLMMHFLVHFRFIIVVTMPLFLSLLLRPLLTHFLSLPPLLPRLCLLLITCSLLFGKVIAPLAILILFTIF